MTARASTRLGDVATFVRGITFKPDDVVPVGSDGSVACMRTRNVQAELDLSDVWGVASFLVRRSDQYLNSGDILVSSANSWNLVGKCSWVPTLPWRSTFGGFVSVLRAEPTKVLPRYLYHWFSSARVQKTVRSFGQKTTNISNLNIDRCLNQVLHLPPIREQERITAILDKADALRALRREAIAKLDTLAQSIFLEMFGILDGGRSVWPIVPFESVISSTRLGLVRGAKELGREHPYPYIRMNAITRGGELLLSDLQATHASAAEAEQYHLEPGDLLFNTRNTEELVGKAALYHGSGIHLFNNNLMRIRFTVDVHPEFVAAALQTPSLRRELQARKSGTTSVFAIYFKDLRTLPFPVPPVGLQREFAVRMVAIDRLKQVQQLSLQHLEANFVATQRRAFRGEL